MKYVDNIELCKEIKRKILEEYEDPGIPLEDYIYYWGYAFPDRDSPPVISYIPEKKKRG